MLIDSGSALRDFLEQNGLMIDHCTAVNTKDNCIYLPDKTSFNWKSTKKQVRVNCKENAKIVIEQSTGFKMTQNGKGDSVRNFSLLLDNEADLLKVIDALKKIEGNKS